MSRCARVLFVVVLLLLSLRATEAAAFCGFYVSGADGKMFNEATQVVLLRDGTRTVLSMQNDYKGPPSDFALVVPVPVVLQKENVKTLAKEIFQRVDTLSSPRLVEYWEQDPCTEPMFDGLGLTGIGFGGAGLGTGQGRLGGGTVKIEAQFEVGEYEIVILSAKDSGGLDTWLRENGYKIPENAAPAFQPYVAAGSKFFVAKVNVAKVKFEGGRAALSPLRFHYDTERFELPVKLGLLNSNGVQDLIVHVIAKDRYDVANYPNVAIPTNLDVSENARARFGEFYVSLFDKTVAENPKAVVTEYAWGANNCDPCPGAVSGLSIADFASLGGDALPGGVSGSAGGTSVTQGAVTVSTGLPPEVVRRIARQSFGRFRLCYENAKTGAPANVTTKFEILADGSVANASVESDASSKTMNDCIARAFGALSFPAPEKTAKVSVVFPLTFGPGAPTGQVGGSFVLTRLHARYGKDSLGSDLVFRKAEPISGGRESLDDSGKLETGAKPATSNAFQARYAIRHGWNGPVACKEPHRGRWGGPWPDAGATEPTKAASNLGLAVRGTTPLSAFTDVNAALLAAPAIAAGSEGDAGAARASDAGDIASDGGAAPKTPASRCGCRAVGARSPAFAGLTSVLALLAFAGRRLRRRP